MPANFFLSPATAERYARARPNLNPLFNEQLLRHTGRVAHAADFGCGTGISSRALAEVAEVVVGLDPSLAMLHRVDHHPRVLYCAALAEEVPFADASFDLVAAALALHWFDRERFLSEAARVLVPDGWLFIYNTWFAGTMLGCPEFSAWSREEYVSRYPMPPRAGRPIVTRDESGPDGFTLQATWNIEANVPMTREQLADYLTTQSNVTAGLEQRDETLEAATQWLSEAVTPFYRAEKEIFPFGGSAWLLQRTAERDPGLAIGSGQGQIREKEIGTTNRPVP